MKIFIYSTYPFLLQSTLLPTQPLFNQSYFFRKSKVKHTGVDIPCLFSICKIISNKAKKCFLEASYEVNQTSKL